ncbi:hypothetical protein [Streptomyces gilvosporeus]|uniref:hypothetical protein n=1 Tax=Streptomyces gilvosporeus TaxID=553510 RepID=UPI0013967F2E|nr:hypothetical protein [Streptomyces gilvosporeus]
MDLGYGISAGLFAPAIAAIAAVAVAHCALDLDAVWSIWIAYVLPRPLGASIGDGVPAGCERAGAASHAHLMGIQDPFRERLAGSDGVRPHVGAR